MGYTKPTDKIIQDLETKRDIVELEKFYLDGQINNLENIVEQRKNEIVDTICKYKEQMLPEYDDDDHVVSFGRCLTPYVVSNYFFRSITNLQNLEPEYSGEQLSILWELYNELVMQVNMNLQEFTPTLSHFCKFIGFTTNGFKKLKKSNDLGISTVATKIDDYFYDNNVRMAELGKHNTRATIYRMKSEQERLEKETPQITIHATNIDLDGINKRIAELSSFDSANKEAKYNE